MALLPSSWIKYFLTPLGAFLPARAIYSLNASIGYLELGRWMRAKGYDTRRRFSRREQLFDLVGQQVRDREVFGVRRLSRQSNAPLVYTPAELEEQTPRVRQLRRTAGELAPPSSERLFRQTRNGEIPQIDDNRVTFFKGWFDQTLRTYKCPPICALNALKKSGPVVNRESGDKLGKNVESNFRSDHSFWSVS